MTEGGLRLTPIPAGDLEAAAPERPASETTTPADAGRDAPVVPLSLLALARDEPRLADDLLWEWDRWEPSSPIDAERPEIEPKRPPVATVPASRSDGAEPAQENVADQTTKPMELLAPVHGRGADETPAGPSAPSATGPEPGPEPGEASLEESPAREDADAATLETGGLSQWSVRVRSAVGRRIRAPSPSDPEGLERPLREPVEAVRRREAARRTGAVPSLKKALPKDPALPVELPAPKPIPVPEAEQLVTEATGLTLKEQVLPVLQQYTYVPTAGRRAGKPQVVKAQVGAGLPPTPGVKVEPIPPPKPAQAGQARSSRGSRLPAVRSRRRRPPRARSG